MSKLTYEDKIEIYNKRKIGFAKISLAKEYKEYKGLRKETLRYNMTDI